VNRQLAEDAVAGSSTREEQAWLRNLIVSRREALNDLRTTDRSDVHFPVADLERLGEKGLARPVHLAAPEDASQTL
jgi:hypothetical protein